MNNEYLELISINLIDMLITIGNLLVLTWVFKKFLWDRVQKVLAARREQVDGLYQEAEVAKEAALKDKTEYEAKLSQADAEAESILKKASARAERRSDEIIENANRKAEETMKKADADIAQEKKKAMNDLKNEISEISVQIAETIVQREINEDDHRELIDSFIENL
ncbi:MAG: F0F1 ATP synthase subunit B [Clostridia bacterium]|nr:F0F1 ATP synthase subunit B [Clostridia bacterium]